MADKFATERGQKWKVKKARGAVNVGLVQARTLAIEDSNIANLGSDLEKKVKMEAARFEGQWADAGKEVGVQIWRIEDFKVVDWPKEEYGSFYSGDSYIILNTYKQDPKSAKLSFDIYFWLGKHTSQDEAGTAAYKTVELDDSLKGVAVQHREVQNFESAGFRKIFPAMITLEGGVASGFNHVGPMTYQTRLLQCKGAEPVTCRQIELKRSNLNSGDCFILDTGLKIYQLNGKESRPAERAEAAKISRAYDDQRGGKAEVIVWDEGEVADIPRNFIPFWQVMGGDGPIKPASEAPADEDAWRDQHRALYRLREEGGKMTFLKVEEGKNVKRSTLAGDDVWIFDSGYSVFVWVGMGASSAERSKGMQYAQQYMADNNVPAQYPCVRILQGGENEAFEAAFRTFQ